MDFEQLRIFLVLAEERTFLGAANRLATSRSRVRRKLDQLEADAGTALVSREQSGLVLTPAGVALARRGRALLEDARQLISHVREVGEEPTGILKIALPFAPAPPGWDEICHSLQQAHPKLGLEFIHAERPEALLPGRAEIALGFSGEPPAGCRSMIVGEYPIRLVASDVYLQRRRPPASLDQLPSHRLAVWRGPEQAPEELRLREGRPLPIAPILVSDDPRAIQRAVSDGDVLGVLPAMPSLDDPSLKPLFTESIAGTATLRLSVPEVLSDLPRVARFLELSATLHPQPG
ncbi:MAG: LysR family transcriptional regulator [bacterium]|nr:LysR family transcriptional regulator [bacterium]